MARSLGIGLLLAVMAASCVGQPETAAQGPTEYQVKAAFLYNFAKFVEWPAEAHDPKGPLAICVLGRDPFDGELERVTEGKTIDNRKIVIRRTRDMAIARSCQVLFVSLSEARRVDEIFEAL